MLARYLFHAVILMSVSFHLWAEEQNTLIISDDVLIATPDGAQLSLLVVRPDINSPLPVALKFTIYANQERERDIRLAEHAASKGYVSVIGYSRGRHLSNSNPWPYKNEPKDVNTVIEWLIKQPWSDGRVAMYGGSYEGFTQWAATKNLHPALKTIVPYAAAIPGYGLPVENGVFLNANFGWPFHVTNHRYNDYTIYEEPERWTKVNSDWFLSGKSYRHIDRFDKRSNYLLHRWLDHPDYDEYWQSLVPVKREFADIAIPVLSITGYFDDAQVSAIRYLQQHETYNAKANHYLLIGPYDHFSTQRQPGETLRDITLDPVSRIDVPEITFEWFDYVLKGAPKPSILKDRINYQVMGSNRWYSAPSLHALNETSKRHHLGENGTLSEQSRDSLEFTRLQVDLTDRDKQNHYYPWPIINESLDSTNGVVFETQRIQQDMIYAGQFSAQLDIKPDRKDVDLNLVLYERTEDDKFFHLSYYLGRASYASDISERTLLKPDEINSIPISGTRMNGKLISKGSKLVLVVAVNKNAFAQVNYGTGKDVSEESIEDAGKPLTLDILNSSHINIPLKAVAH